MRVEDLDVVVPILREEVKRWEEPAVSKVGKRDPFRVLISCLLSLRTKDVTTEEASKRLFKVASTPYEIMNLPLEEIERLIYPVGFYRNKAKVLKEVSRDIVERFGGRVPDNMDDLLSLKGVGRKTANLVLIKGFGKEGICVDTHVHRISNRWGLVRTKTPEETEEALRKVLPKKYWMEFNDLLVPFGQNLCKPVSPLCSSCKIRKYCDRVGVVRSR